MFGLDFPALARNTILVAVLMVLGTTISSAIVAYGFAKIRFKGNGILFGLMLATMMIPFPVSMVSVFTIFRWLGDHTPFQMLGTLRAVVAAGVVWLGLQHLFAAPVFHQQYPDELSEAATVDGCWDRDIFGTSFCLSAQPPL